jgi:hypothetical protein
MGEPPVSGLPSLATEFAATISNSEVWFSIGQALLVGGVCLLLGIWTAHKVGLLAPDAPAGEALGVGLASGLMVLAAWWAAIASGGRSSFTPVAIGFAIAIVFAMVGRERPVVPADSLAPAPPEDGAGSTGARAQSSPLRPLIFAALAGGVFVVAVALLYGSTMVPSPRDGMQPVGFNDEAFYSVLGSDLAATGTETNISPSGFAELPGVPAQTWYHWGELWLASAVIKVFGTAPLAARYFVILPVLLLAAAALTGTLVRRMTGATSRRAYLFGFVTCLVLAPVPWIAGPFYSMWGVGLLFGITQYGLAAVAVLLALYCLAVLGGRTATWALAGFVGSAVALIAPAHIVIALLALVGAGSVCIIRVLQSLTTARRLPVVAPIWRRTFIATAIALVATVAWGLLTEHGTGAGGVAASVSPFNASWRDTVAITILGAGVFLAIPIAWFLARRKAPAQADVYLGTMVLLVAGAIAWGARLGDVNMFHVFLGGVSVFATPVAAVAVYTLWARLRETRHPVLALGVVVLCVFQLEWGGANVGLRLWQLGPRYYPPISVSLLGAIRQLPPDAKLAYACRPFEEVSFVNSRLVSIDAFTGRRVVPMCFEADVTSTLVGAPASLQAPAAGFQSAPQWTLYPDAAAHPSSATVAAFLKANGIDYIYVDSWHPNSLVTDAIPIATSGDGQVLRVP